MLVPQFLQDFALVFQTLIVFGVAGSLEDELLTVTLDEQGDRAGALAKALQYCEVPWQPVSFLRAGGVFDEVLFRGRQLIFHVIQAAQKVGHRVDAACDFRVRAVLNEELQILAGPVQDRADLQALGLAQLVAQLQAVCRRRNAGEQVIGDRAKGEDVEMLADVPVVGDSLGSHVGGARIFH